MSTKNENYLQNQIFNLKSCAECILKNAESIVGSEPYQRGLRVTIMLNPGEAPNINIDKDIIPESIVF